MNISLTMVGEAEENGTTMIIMGIDPGVASMGYGVIRYESNHFTTLDYGTFHTEPQFTLCQRLMQIDDFLSELIAKHRPHAVSVEELFFNNNAKTALMVGHARGVILLNAGRAAIPLFEYTPPQVKQAVVGYGRAEKKQVMQMVKTLLGLKEIPRPDDTADALAVAICHAHSSGSRLPIL